MMVSEHEKSERLFMRGWHRRAG